MICPRPIDRFEYVSEEGEDAYFMDDEQDTD